jgi:RNA polymerase sigma-70 factor, ECF subfamily
VDDSRLLERMRHGDEHAFAELFARHRVPVFRYAMHMGGAGQADDIVQEVFLALLRQHSQFDPSRGSLQAYLLGIARRQILKRAAAQHFTVPIENDGGDVVAIESSAASPFDDLRRAEAVERVRAAIATLPPVYREAIVLCELNEVDYATAAAVMECPIGTVRSRLHRGRALLVAKLADMRNGALIFDGH